VNSSPSSTPLFHRRLLFPGEPEPLQLPDVPTSRGNQEHWERVQKLLLDRTQLDSSLNDSFRSVSDYSPVSTPSRSTPSTSTRSSPVTSASSSRRGSEVNFSMPSPSVPSSRHISSTRFTSSQPASRVPSRRPSVNDEHPLYLEFMKRKHSLKLDPPTLATERFSENLPSSYYMNSPQSSGCHSPNPPRRWFASFFKRRPSLDPTYSLSPKAIGGQLSPTATSTHKLIRSSSLPNDIPETNYHHAHNGYDPPITLGFPEPKVSRSEISSSHRSSHRSPVPLLSLFTPLSPLSPPSSATSSPSTSMIITPPNTNTVGLPTLFEGRFLSKNTKG